MEIAASWTRGQGGVTGPGWGWGGRRSPPSVGGWAVGAEPGALAPELWGPLHGSDPTMPLPCVMVLVPAKWCLSALDVGTWAGRRGSQKVDEREGSDQPGRLEP